jgi:formylglycine-generating enzyme required for sulfatase activity
MNLLACWALTAILLACPLVVLADEAADTFNKLYGEDLKRVAATPWAADDVALAKQLLEVAGKVTNQTAFLTLLCEKAHELAIKDSSGYPTAKAALELLAANIPEKKVESLQKLAAMYQRPYATARADAKAKAGETLIEALKVLADAQVAAEDFDGAGATLKQALTVATAIKSESKAAILAQLAGLAPKQQIEKQIAGLKAKLDADPKDESSRQEIVRLYLVEMNNPAEAAKFVDETLDQATRKYVPAATKSLEEAPELACSELGEWYRGLADQAKAPASKTAMLQHAKAYYQRFLDLHTTDDLARIGATLMLKKIDDALTKAAPVAQSKSTPSTPSSPSSSSLLTMDLGKGVTMKLVRIPRGKFIMGSPDSEEGRQGIEGPQHEVTISKPFYMGVTEVTQEQYEAVVGTNPSGFRGPTNPVESVSWNDVTAFCWTLSQTTHKTVRLPTEAEWEYACRAGSTTRFSFGDSDNALAEYAWFGGNWAGAIHPVGQKKPNAWGLYDMHGNMWEWCQDWFGAYAAGAVTDPGGPSSGSGSVVRGGSANSHPYACRSAGRREHSKGDRYLNIGFRACVDLK